MPHYQEIPVAALEEPENPMRQDSIMEGMDELVGDIAANGLINPITVRDIGDGKYRVIAGHRRSIAVTILQWSEVGCMVYASDEAVDDNLMAAENLQRTQVNALEEARLYRRITESEGISPKLLGMRLNVPESRIMNLIDITHGDEAVQAALGAGKINVAQATAINKFASATYKGLALEQAVTANMSASRLDRWRREIQAAGAELQIDANVAAARLLTDHPPEQQLMICQLQNHGVPITEGKTWWICGQCQALLMEALRALQREEARANHA